MAKIIDPEMLITAYSQGYFPMAEGKGGKVYWHSPDPRAVIPLNYRKIPRSVRQAITKHGFEFRVNTAFERVIELCSERKDSWISGEIIESYCVLHRLGFAHSVETYIDSELTGGLYGVTLGGAFFGESMFSSVTNASKAAFYHLYERLLQRGFVLLDTQYINYHTELLGAVEIPKYLYLKYLSRALKLPCKFDN